MTLTYTITTSADLAMSMTQDRALGHRTVMQLWGHLDTPTPRADLGILWAITNIDIPTATGTLMVRSHSQPPNKPDWCHDIVTRPAEPGDCPTIG